jgi:precorrin-6B C5,15-methyltransferase / cobalt-precorrin-6B C5,C15-methyltransferase
VIFVIGMDGRSLEEGALLTVETAVLVAGAQRHLDALGVPFERRRALGPIDPVLDEFSQTDETTVILASGDPGFFGINRRLRVRGDLALTIPAMSSVTQAFGFAGLSWDDAVIVSTHGRDLRPALNVIRANPKVGVLTGPGAGPAEIGAALAARPNTAARQIIVGCDFGGPDERVEYSSPAEAARRTWDDPNVVIILDLNAPNGDRGWLAGHQGAPSVWALPETAFEHRDSMITKAEVRALVLAHLAPRIGTCVWDIGAGSGSVAIECARFGAAAVTIERDPAACALIAANADRHGVYVDVVNDEAPTGLTDLPPPDSIFVGGGGLDVLRAALTYQPERVVITLAAIDRVGEARTALAEAGLTVDGVQLQASRLAPLPGDALRLQATNPVFVLWGVE